MSEIYEHPRYYDVAFSFRDAAREVDFFEECAERFSAVELESVLEVACGPSPYLGELSARGYTFAGLDRCPEMLAHSREKAADEDCPADESDTEFVRADMTDFSLADPRDLAFCALGSWYLDSNAALRNHLDSMAAALRPGALYLAEGCVFFPGDSPRAEEWSESSETAESGDELEVRYEYSEEVLNPAAQTVRRSAAMTVRDDGDCRTFTEDAVIKRFYPQELRLLADDHGEFEVVGHFDAFDLDRPVADAEPGELARPVTVFRRI